MPDLAPRRLILSIYGLYAREENNWLSVGSLVALMGHLGVDSAGTRSSISRLKRRGVLESVKFNGSAGYTLSDDALEVLRAGDLRIFGQPRASIEDGFVIIVFSVPESQRAKRHQLRSALGAMGFGTVSPGVWIAPAPLREEVAHALRRRGLRDYAHMFHAHHDGFWKLSELVGQWWDLEAIDAEYQAFTKTYEGTGQRLVDVGNRPQTSFETYIPMLTQWRRLPYRDPGLPAELLPATWHGYRAHTLFAELDALMREPAHRHAMSIIHR